MRFNGLRSHVSKMSSLKFLEVQVLNKQNGHLKIDHKEGTLIPVVKLRENESNVSDASGMSGGERSYTTLALLMSLTNSIDSPFTCMDEFDVFMDEKNRRTSVQVMLGVAQKLKKRYHSCFVFEIDFVTGHASDMHRTCFRLVLVVVFLLTLVIFLSDNFYL